LDWIHNNQHGMAATNQLNSGIHVGFGSPRVPVDAIGIHFPIQNSLYLQDTSLLSRGESRIGPQMGLGYHIQLAHLVISMWTSPALYSDFCHNLQVWSQFEPPKFVMLIS
jgi:hypothetical protein